MQPGVDEVAVDRHGVEHSRQLEVVGEAGAARHLGRGVVSPGLVLQLVHRHLPGAVLGPAPCAVGHERPAAQEKMAQPQRAVEAGIGLRAAGAARDDGLFVGPTISNTATSASRPGASAPLRPSRPARRAGFAARRRLISAKARSGRSRSRAKTSSGSAPIPARPMGAARRSSRPRSLSSMREGAMVGGVRSRRRPARAISRRRAARAASRSGGVQSQRWPSGRRSQESSRKR